ncbi:hypothetical protein AURDEDRAFT_167934 [Auricularia subglabra TFB-10046 SS5]|nr:hypothetical protein AURDEDRAFT_167934 [Auricularia subglabra TFB-10046 SS5]
MSQNHSYTPSLQARALLDDEDLVRATQALIDLATHPRVRASSFHINADGRARQWSWDEADVADVLANLADDALIPRAAAGYKPVAEGPEPRILPRVHWPASDVRVEAGAAPSLVTAAPSSVAATPSPVVANSAPALFAPAPAQLAAAANTSAGTIDSSPAVGGPSRGKRARDADGEAVAHEQPATKKSFRQS